AHWAPIVGPSESLCEADGALYIARPQSAITVEPTTGSLRPKAARGVLQMIVLRVIGTALARVAQFILPLCLLPSDFALFALATVCMGLFFLSFAMFWRLTPLRALPFGRASIPDNFGKWVGVVLAVGLAILGFGYWSLLYGAITGTAIGGVSQVAWSLLREPKWRPRLAFDPAIARSLMRFGQFVMLAGFANYIAHSIDNAIVGYVLGIAPLGYYSFAYSLGVYLTSNLT